MDEYKQKINLTFFLLIFACVLSGYLTRANAESSAERIETSASASKKTNPATPLDKVAAQKIINRYIAGVARTSGASEYKEARKIVYGDVDGDGDADAAVQFTIEGMGGGNNYAFYLAIFRNENGKLKPLTDEVVGGKLNRNVTLQKIDDRKIYLDTDEYAENDGACCPSIKGKTVYILKNNKLTEQKSNVKNKK
jgi:hypothetical protein